MVCTPFESCLQLRYAVLAHRVLRLVQVVDTLRKIRHANELPASPAMAALPVCRRSACQGPRSMARRLACPSSAGGALTSH